MKKTNTQHPVRKTTISKSSGRIVDARRSRAAIKASATRKANAAARKEMGIHHKIIAGGLIAIVIIWAALGIKGVLSVYAGTSSPTTFVGLAGKCIDDRYGKTVNKNYVWLYRCNGTGAQKWVMAGGAIVTSLGATNYCIDDPGASRLSGIAVWLYRCNGTAAQKWTISGNRLLNAASGHCLAVKGGATANGTRLVLNPCDGSAAQRWVQQGNTVAQPVTSTTPATAPTPSQSPSGHWTTKFASTNATNNSVNCNSQSNVTISGHTFSNIGDDRPSITIDNCTNVTITDNDFINDCEPIYVYNSRNVTITWNRYLNITGPHTRNGSNRGNFTQWNNSFSGLIANNKGIGGDTEDIVSIYKSGGNSPDDPLVIENNAFEGTDWSSQSGSGFMLGDGGGGHIIVRNNTLVNPGQVGIGISGGSDIHVTGNTIYGAQRTSSNVGIYVANYSGGPMGGEEVSNNQVDWKNASGTNNPAYNSGDAGTVAGWSTNNFNANLNLNALSVTL